LGWIWGDLGIDMPKLMPSGDRLEEIGALATLIDENRYTYGLDALCAWRGLPGKDQTKLMEGIATLNLPKSRKKKFDPRPYIYRLPVRYVEGYACGDTIATLALYENLRPILDKERTVAAYRLECDLLPMVLAMRRRGIRIDEDAVTRALDGFLRKRDEALAELSAKLECRPLVMAEIRSKKWLKSTFDRLGIKYELTEKNKPSFQGGSKGWMTKHAHFLPSLISRANKFHEAADKFLNGHIRNHIVNGRIHAEIHPHRSEANGTKSFRFSYSEPPLQQIPARDPEITEAIRAAFLPEEGEVWAKPDVSQQEFRLLVHCAVVENLAGAATIAECYRRDPDTDFHSLTAAKAGIDRSSGKQLNFAKIYGAGVKKLAATIGKSLAETQALIDQYNRELPFINRLDAVIKHRAHDRGFIELYDGARRHFDRFAPGGKWEKGLGPCALEEAKRRIKDPGHPW
jgi:DNA polymerase I-like protein with 3'-5' exonuclease and polymerase domains